MYRGYNMSSESDPVRATTFCEKKVSLIIFIKNVPDVPMCNIYIYKGKVLRLLFQCNALKPCRRVV